MRAHGEEEEERWRAREQDLLVRLEDSRNRERKLEDQKHNLEVCLADATQQIQELKVHDFDTLWNFNDSCTGTMHGCIMVNTPVVFYSFPNFMI